MVIYLCGLLLVLHARFLIIYLFIVYKALELREIRVS